MRRLIITTLAVDIPLLTICDILMYMYHRIIVLVWLFIVVLAVLLIVDVFSS